MPGHGWLLFLLLAVVAAVEQTLQVRAYTVIKLCQRSTSPGQRRRMSIDTGPRPSLEENPSFAATINGNSAYAIFHRPEGCPDGFRCIRGRCRKVIRCADEYAMKRGLCRQRRKFGKQSQMLTTAAPTATTVEEETSATSTTTPAPTGTMVHFPTRCRDGYMMVGGRCRRIWTYGQQSWITPSATKAAPWAEEDDTTKDSTSTVAYFPFKCRDGYVMVGKRCRRLLKVRESRSTKSQSSAKRENDDEAGVSDSNKMKRL